MSFINVALPMLEREFGVGLNSVTWWFSLQTFHWWRCYCRLGSGTIQKDNRSPRTLSSLADRSEKLIKQMVSLQMGVWRNHFDHHV